MGLQCGIVGLPNVGKSTLFNCLSNAKAQAANFPFCTIEPNIGMINVPDERLNKLAELVHPQKIVPATIQIVDIAGLVKGASKGEGLGNQFLGNIRETDAILHVIRCFEDDNVVHVDGSVNPLREKETIDFELEMKDLEAVEKKSSASMLLQKQVLTRRQRKALRCFTFTKNILNRESPHARFPLLKMTSVLSLTFFCSLINRFCMCATWMRNLFLPATNILMRLRKPLKAKRQECF